MGKVISLEEWKLKKFIRKGKYEGNGLDLIWWDDTPEFIPLSEEQIKNHWWWTKPENAD